MPMTPFIGVRISWLMLARKSDLSRDASVALSRASAIAASAPTSAVTSARVPTQPAMPPSPSGIDLEVTSTIRGVAPGTADLEAMAELGPVPAPGELGDRGGPRCSGADDRVPRLPDRLVRRDAGDLGPARVGVDVPVLGVGLEDADGRGVGEQPQLVGGGLHLAACGGERLGLEEEVGEDRDLGPQLVGRDRGEDEVDGAFGVEVGADDLVAAVRGDEDDRRHLGLPPLPDERGRLEAVHHRHADVEQDDREVLRHDAAQARRARSRLRRWSSRAAAAPAFSASRFAALSSTTRIGTAAGPPSRSAHRRPAPVAHRRGHAAGCAGSRQPRLEGREQLGGVDRLRARSRWRRRRGSVGVRRRRPCR